MEYVKLKNTGFNLKTIWGVNIRPTEAIKSFYISMDIIKQKQKSLSTVTNLQTSCSLELGFFCASQWKHCKSNSIVIINLTTAGNVWDQLKMFLGQSFKLPSPYVYAWHHNTIIDWHAINSNGVAIIQWSCIIDFSSILAAVWACH